MNIERLRSELLNKTFIEEVIYLEETNSTNLYSRNLKDRDNVLVAAEFQNSGRGRRDNTWISDKAKNLTFTILKKIPVKSSNLQYINYFFTLCISQYLQKFLIKNNSNKSVIIKWPNDILIDSKKVCGLLIEHNVNSNTFFIGIGVNINQVNFPHFVNIKAVSLKNILHHEIDRYDFLTGLIIHFHKNLKLILQNRFDLIFKRWKKHAIPLMTKVCITDKMNKTTKGLLIGYLEEGGVIVEINGKTQILRVSTSNIIPDFSI